MDPRHPEEAISRMVDLMTQFNLILTDMKHATVSTKLGQLEREGGLVVQEICLVAPRLHEAMMQTSRQRRYELSHGVVVGTNDQIIAINEATTEEAEIVEKPERYAEMAEVLDHSMTKEREQIFEEMTKPKKKTTRKKKTTKKAEK